ncbi:MAG: type II toxin-antitoxin system RelE/ParE family toxin [Nitrospira sp.]|nr:type II toxin-antitoxin system RelE/ParE family toxin [Nitrospira sp.]
MVASLPLIGLHSTEPCGFGWVSRSPLAAHSECGELLKRELGGLRKYRVRRFRIAYAINQKKRIIRLMAVDYRRSMH